MKKKKSKNMMSKSTHKADAKRHSEREKAFESEALHVAKTGEVSGVHYPSHMKERISKHRKTLKIREN
jgi:hypothetical protein